MRANKRLLCAWTLCAVLGGVSTPALAQFRRGPDRGGGDRGDWQRRMLGRMDSNGNGVLETAEVSPRARPFHRPVPTRQVEAGSTEGSATSSATSLPTSRC